VDVYDHLGRGCWAVITLNRGCIIRRWSIILVVVTMKMRGVQLCLMRGPVSGSRPRGRRGPGSRCRVSNVLSIDGDVSPTRVRLRQRPGMVDAEILCRGGGSCWEWRGGEGFGIWIRRGHDATGVAAVKARTRKGRCVRGGVGRGSCILSTSILLLHGSRHMVRIGRPVSFSRCYRPRRFGS